MTAPRRLGAPDAKNRTVLLDAAEQLMRDEGYAAVTSRRVAEQAGLKPQLVHYYFRTMDDLFLEMFRRGAEAMLQHHQRALKARQPLWALWELTTDAAGTAMTMEFVALSNHRKALRTEIARYAEMFRVEQIKTLTSAIERYDVDFDEFPPTVLMVLMTGATQVLVQEQMLGMTTGHEETAQFAEKWLTILEGERLPDDDWRAR
ncbi:TetR/AcrR family transcriptional regulator [Mycolicibacterium komossense]|uniref:TetR/AcrR family transcriptional regulator n=1 Tax=Mycolicibacterium komossense TaxID=1779 RepID=A0ABT3CHK6_9MYCO|nr:TetR/AcrR family transcriptional regulator [Mycolicibacterium komossense]MCV7228984.1 TetR/AcrR family transcriptional regulator [Mycolicibacterium komossense]